MPSGGGDPVPSGAGEAGEADAGAGTPQGLSWTWELDLGALLASLTDGSPSDEVSAAGRPDATAPDATAPGGGTPDAGAPSGGAAGTADEEAVQQAIQDDLDAL